MNLVRYEFEFCSLGYYVAKDMGIEDAAERSVSKGEVSFVFDDGRFVSASYITPIFLQMSELYKEYGILFYDLGTRFRCPHCGDLVVIHYHDPKSNDVACLRCAGKTFPEFVRDRALTDRKHRVKNKWHATYQQSWPFAQKEVL